MLTSLCVTGCKCAFCGGAVFDIFQIQRLKLTNCILDQCSGMPILFLHGHLLPFVSCVRHREQMGRPVQLVFLFRDTHGE